MTTTQIKPEDYLTEAGLEAHNRFNAAVDSLAANMTFQEARQVLEWYGKQLPKHGVWNALVKREAAKAVLAAQEAV